MAVKAEALTTLEAVKDELGISASDTSKDARLTRYIHTASAEIERYCGRKFSRATVTEKLRPGGGQKILLARTPVASVTSVKDNGTDVTDYSLEDAAAGILYRAAGWTGSARCIGIAYDRVPGTEQASLEVEYVGGYVTPGQELTDSPGELERDLPDGLEWACIETVKALACRQNVDPNVASEQLGDYAVTYAGANAAIGRGVGGILPDVVLPTLNKFKRSF